MPGTLQLGEEEKVKKTQSLPWETWSLAGKQNTNNQYRIRMGLKKESKMSTR